MTSRSVRRESGSVALGARRGRSRCTNPQRRDVSLEGLAGHWTPEATTNAKCLTLCKYRISVAWQRGNEA